MQQKSNRPLTVNELVTDAGRLATVRDHIAQLDTDLLVARELELDILKRFSDLDISLSSPQRYNCVPQYARISDSVTSAFDANPGVSVRANDILHIAGLPPSMKGTVRVCIQRLVERGYVERVGRGVYLRRATGTPDPKTSGPFGF